MILALDSFLFWRSLKNFQAIFVLKHNKKNLQFNIVNKFSGFFHKQLNIWLRFVTRFLLLIKSGSISRQILRVLGKYWPRFHFDQM